MVNHHQKFFPGDKEHDCVGGMVPAQLFPWASESDRDEEVQTILSGKSSFDSPLFLYELVTILDGPFYISFSIRLMDSRLVHGIGKNLFLQQEETLIMADKSINLMTIQTGSVRL